jgi:hypothetical protein
MAVGLKGREAGKVPSGQCCMAMPRACAPRCSHIVRMFERDDPRSVGIERRLGNNLLRQQLA